MRIWSILLSLFSYCKRHAFTLNTLWGFCNIYVQSTVFVLEGGGGNFNISSSLYFHFAIKFRLLLSICGLHFCAPSIWKCFLRPCLESWNLKSMFDECGHRIGSQLGLTCSLPIETNISSRNCCGFFFFFELSLRTSPFFVKFTLSPISQIWQTASS